MNLNFIQEKLKNNYPKTDNYNRLSYFNQCHSTEFYFMKDLLKKQEISKVVLFFSEKFDINLSKLLKAKHE